MNSEIQRSFSHCSTLEMKHKQANRVMLKYLKNDYPLEVVVAGIKKGFKGRGAHSILNKEEKKAIKWIKIPYVPGLYEACKNVCESHEIKLVPSMPYSLEGSLRKKERGELDEDKMKQANLSRDGVVYAITCSNCRGMYVGQTGRQLVQRIKEHERAINRGELTNACAKHTSSEKHSMNLLDIKTVYCEKNWGMRVALEAYTIAANHSRVINISPPAKEMIKWVKLINELGQV